MVRFVEIKLTYGLLTALTFVTWWWFFLLRFDSDAVGVNENSVSNWHSPSIACHVEFCLRLKFKLRFVLEYWRDFCLWMIKSDRKVNLQWPPAPMTCYRKMQRSTKYVSYGSLFPLKLEFWLFKVFARNFNGRLRHNEFMLTTAVVLQSRHVLDSQSVGRSWGLNPFHPFLTIF